MKKTNILFSLVLLALVGAGYKATAIAQTQIANQGNLSASASQQTLQISSAMVVQLGDNPLIEIDGTGFSKDAKVMVNDNGLLLAPEKVKRKKLMVQVPSSSLCSGTVMVRVIVGTTSSNTVTFSYQKSAPIIYSLSPQHAKAGSVVEIKADNLACDPSNNLVTVNDMPVSVLGLDMGKLTVRIPDNFISGNANIRLTVSSQSSLPSAFTIDPKDSLPGSGNTDPNNPKLSFLSTAPAGSSFAPMFNIHQDVNFNNATTDLWNVMFYGMHQCIIDLPIKVDGFNQKALFTINVREVNGIYGSSLNQKQRFIYGLVQFPRNPEKIYSPDTNPFYWGACAAATESNPSGGFIFNSVARSGGGIDSFEITKDASASGKAVMTMTLIAPDLGYYEDYGINYAKAGNGQVRLPKVMTVTVEMSQIDPNLPASKFVVGKVTINDFINGSMATQNPTFTNTFSITDVPDFGLGGIFR